MKQSEFNTFPHRRKNILTGDWILVSPHRTKRPWQGEVAKPDMDMRPGYDPDCYLCPGNKRANGEINPDYKNTFVFTNDYSALFKNNTLGIRNKKELLISKGEKGICRVVNFSPCHNLTLAELSHEDIIRVVETWQEEYQKLSADPDINYITIFENKGSMMGNSNPHPHCQIWAQESIPDEPSKELKRFEKYYKKNSNSILSDYIKIEKSEKERIVYENKHFVVILPFWAVWPYETLLIPKIKIANILKLGEREKKEFADALKIITTKYDNLFQTSFPYSAGIHQSPCDGKKYPGWHFHMHFYPPLLRSANIKKHMVGYEMMSEPQRDLTPEYCAEVLRNLPEKHYKQTNKG